MKKLSVIAQKKIDQGYLKSGPTCSNCKFFTSQTMNAGGYSQDEKMKRCTIGGFAIGKSAWCMKHKFK